MADISEDATRLIGEMTLACSARCNQKIFKAGPDRVALDGDTQKFIHVAMEMVAQAKEVQTLSQRSGTILSQHVGALSSLIRRSIEVTEIGQAIRTATTKYIYSRLLMKSRDHDVHKLLSHFKPKIRAIIGDTLGSIGGNPNVLSTVLEKCYEQSSSQGGELHIDGYFAPLYEASPAWPYDPDYEAEQYNDDEDRLQVDEDYAEAERDLPESPRYLFRTFDSASSGKSDEDMVASSASIYMPGISRDDLLSLEPKEACKKLCVHLGKTCFGDADHADNLMSWSSSLLFVLQYAIWRCITLEKLIQSGLHDLHPEFAHTSGREGWTNRVRDLRLVWAESRLTTQKEVKVASQIATTCFHALSTSEIAICLLTFKTRDYPSTSMKSKLPRLSARSQG
ncbi:hypothetical protein LTR91_022425 [Friedmanniomyces endolithicus]|uniref:Uncharacterized protein n=1 Tax=Friedmanniomyces endolithicus TaxID=329885 RepID=A0AAN6H674_9PEZI|nr:hypothetical protein LTR75_017665 [Friedmanniomyces endolithicus]KAK0847022.1 hypothetical protein LTR03_006532 [Friedmanniomyces endolithicus]KAK0956310.1 hypothetical protein LTR91_022425 [Friedmanniomyces endolithicus]